MRVQSGWNSNPSSQAHPNRHIVRMRPFRLAGPTLLDVNEVVPWSSRARDATASVGRRLGDVFQSLWDWFTDLGTGAWVLGRQPRRRVRRSLPFGGFSN
jgi:hypothetical protein